MKNKMNNELAVCGFEAVRALARRHPDSIRRFYYSDARKTAFGELFRALAARKAPYNMVSDGELEKLCGTVHHQGVVAMIGQPQLPHLTVAVADGWVERGESVLLLDRVGNANNLGAIVRSAAFFGIRSVVIPRDEAQSSVTTSSYRVAQGGMEFVDVYTIRSVEKLLSSMKGRMVRFGTDVRAKTSVDRIPSLCGGKGALVVLGNEESGISDEVRRNCDHLVLIPSAGGAIESLNVAQAASVVLYELRRR